MSPKTMALATLIALVACDASAQAIGTQDRVPNLSGLYRCVRNCAGASLARITAYGWNLLLTNELGQTTKAWIDWPGHIWMPALNEGAVYSPDGFTIQFNRGSTRNRFPDLRAIKSADKSFSRSLARNCERLTAVAGRERSAQPRPQTPNCYVAVTVESSVAEYSSRNSHIPSRGGASRRRCPQWQQQSSLGRTTDDNDHP
jgi:hypothetical protein